MAEYQHPELRNLATELSEEELTKIAQTCLEDYKKDLESRQPWEDMHAQWLRAYYQKDKPVNPPWEGSSDESVPMLAEACNQFHARAFRAMFPSRNIIQAIPVGKVDEFAKERAERVATHLSWQLMVRDRTYKRNKDRLLLSLPLHGSFFTKTYYDPALHRNVIRNVRASDLIVPYGVGPRDLDDLDRKTEVIWLSRQVCDWLFEEKYFSVKPEPAKEGAVSSIDTAHDQSVGIQAETSKDRWPSKLIEQHRFLDLDNDGLGEPYIVVVDTAAEKVCRISIRWDTDELGNPVREKIPVEYYTAYHFLDNPDGFYGLGMGHLIGQINIAVNKMLRQGVDAGTLANVGNMSGFVSKGIAVKKGELELQLGKFIQTESSVEDLNKGIYQFKFPGPQAALFQFMELLMARSDRLATVTEAITGQTEKVMQPTTILALIEQSQLWFSTVYERVLGSWEDELLKIFRLNRKFMDPKEYFSVLDVDGALQQFTAAREDYEMDLQVLPIADPRLMTEQQRIAKADAEFQFLVSNPLVMQSPLHLYNASKRWLLAHGSDGIDEILPNPLQGQLPPVDNAEVENAMALAPMPLMPPAYPHQDHMLHLQIHEKLMQDPAYAPRFGEAGRQAMTGHIQQHISFLYGQTENAGQGGVGAMAPITPDGTVPPAANGSVPPELAQSGLPGGAEGDTGAMPSAGMGPRLP